MKLGMFKFIILFFFLLNTKTLIVFAQDQIESVPLINLEELSPTFEEEKDELESNEYIKKMSNQNKQKNEQSVSPRSDKIFINLKALDKITAKTSTIRMSVGEKKFFGTLEIKALKCQLSETDSNTDIVAYLQVQDTSAKDNDRVFLFNGWTFASSPTLQSIDHPVYDLWITGCENI